MIQTNKLKKIYNEGKSNELQALKGINITIEKGEFCTIVGPSGSGKTTLLKCLSGLEKATQGEVTIGGKNIVLFSKKEFNEFKKNEIGFIFQEYNLIDDLTLLENICLDKELTDIVKQLIVDWDLEKAINLFPSQCSGGQQQKAAILRALMKDTKILFCDEPTGALDAKSAKDVLKVLQDVQKTIGTTIVLITHNDLIKKISNKVLTIHDGNVLHTEINDTVLLANEVEW